jgi:hypothetical protein
VAAVASAPSHALGPRLRVALSHLRLDRGVALAIALLTDGGGPLYRPWAPGELHDPAEAARRAL